MNASATIVTITMANSQRGSRWDQAGCKLIVPSGSTCVVPYRVRAIVAVQR